MAAQVQRLVINKKWAQAITNGDFEDDDAQQVKGIDTMDDGNMARRRRQQAAQTAFQYVHCNYSASSLPRDQNGQVPPRSRFPGTRHGGNFMSGRVPLGGDEPVDINTTFTAPIHRQAPPRGPGPPTSSSAPRPVSNGSTRGQNLSPSKAAPTNKIAAAAAASTVAPNPPPPTLSVSHLLPGDAIMLQLPISMQSAALPERGQRYQAKVVLILGRTYKDDKIIFNLDKTEIVDVEYSIGEYCNRLDASHEALMLQFTANKKPVFYAVDFGSTDGKKSFDESLRKLVDRSKLKQAAPKSPIPTETRTPPRTTIPPAAVDASSTEIFLEAPKPPKVTIPGSKAVPKHILQPGGTGAAVPQTTVAPKSDKETALQNVAQAPMPSQAPSRVAGTPFSPQLTESQLDDIVACVVDTAIYMRDCTPDDYSIDAMKSVIRGATAAFMMRQNPDFAKLNSRNRAELVEGHWIPAVTDRFFGWLRTAQKENTQKELQKECLRKQEIIETKVRRVYSKVELMALKSAAVDMTHKLPGKKAFEDPNLEERRKRQQAADIRRATTSVPSIGSQILRAATAADWVHGRDQNRPAPPQPSNPPQSAPKLIATNSLTAKVEPSTNVTKGDNDSSQELADWIFGSKKAKVPKQHTGLNNSIHNLSNTDVLGVNAGQFTGAFTQSAEFQDLVDIFNQADQSKDEISPLTQEFRRLSLK